MTRSELAVISHGAGCCSVVQRVAARYSVLQCVAMCCRVFQCVAVCRSMRHDLRRAVMGRTPPR